MTHGRGFVKDRVRCGLCGLKNGLKTRCYEPTCRGYGERKNPYHFHITCARQAGYEVDHKEDDPRVSDAEDFLGELQEIIPKKAFTLLAKCLHSRSVVSCYLHGGNEYNLRARLEDLIEVEKRRSGKKFGKADMPMKFNHASKLVNCSILVVRMLGWAWRWAELWVEHDSSWEPLLEPGQQEENMTKAQLKIIDSTPESRCRDARLCRLAAFGAALRNRAYDTEDGFDNESLECALRAVLNTKSLVGPWKDHEIDFFVD